MFVCCRPWSVCEVVLVPYVYACTVVCVACVHAEREFATVTVMLVWGMEKVWLW